MAKVVRKTHRRPPLKVYSLQRPDVLERMDGFYHVEEKLVIVVCQLFDCWGPQ